jgi:hypothetical protein
MCHDARVPVRDLHGSLAADTAVRHYAVRVRAAWTLVWAESLGVVVTVGRKPVDGTVRIRAMALR